MPASIAGLLQDARTIPDIIEGTERRPPGFAASSSGANLRTNWFIVVYANGKWWVDNEGHAFGPFPTREIAALEAIEYAKKLGDPSRLSRIYWPDRTGKMHLIREL